MLQPLRWTSIVAFLLICLPSVQATADEQPASDKPAAGGPALCYDAWILEMTPRAADRILGARAPVVRSPVRKLRPEAGRWLLDWAKRSPSQRLRSQVRGCTAPGHPGVVAEEFVYTYIQDYEVEVGMSGAYIADPIVGTLPWGIRLALHADEPGRVRLDGFLGALVRPVADFTTKLGVDLETVTIQLPEMRMTAIQRTIDAKPGDWLLAGSRMHFTRKDGTRPTRRYVLMHLRPPETKRAEVMTEIVMARVPAGLLPKQDKPGVQLALDEATGTALLAKWRADENADVRELPSLIGAVGDEMSAFVGDLGWDLDDNCNGEADLDSKVMSARVLIEPGYDVVCRVAWRPEARTRNEARWPLLRTRSTWRTKGDGGYMLLTLARADGPEGEACVSLVRVRKMGDDEPRLPSSFTPPEEPGGEAAKK